MMRRSLAVLLAAQLAPAVTPHAGAQAWNDERTLRVVERATERRARQIADTALVSYKAAAHGYLTFLAQLGEGFTEPPKIVRADELALEVYWQAPNRSKQLIAGRRDTLLLPTDINYHRDHLGIIQNNFPSIIRLGDGDEVRDVPHPLSADGLRQYDFSIRDSLQVRLGPRVLEVYEVRVRPKNDREPRAVGAVFLDRESGEVVRMAFSFTRAALRDKELEDVSVVLENGLIESFWLPRRQEIEIRRTGTWLDYPARGIIRGRWEICCYEVNRPFPALLFAGPEIALAPAGTPNPFPFTGSVLDSLPSDVRAVTDADVARVQEEARALVRAQSLARARGAALSARSVSDFIRVNRVEGLALGGGATLRFGEGLSLAARGRYGLADEKAKGRTELAFRRASGAVLSLAAFDDHREASDVRETSQAVSSIAAQEFGTDFTDPYGSRGVSLSARSAPIRGWLARAELAFDEQRPLAVNASPANGTYEPVLAAASGEARRVSLSLERPTHLGPLGLETQLGFGASAISWSDTAADSHAIWRLTLRASLERPVGNGRLVTRSFAAWVPGARDIPAQFLVQVGGPVTAPGYEFHRFAGRAAVSQRVEAWVPVPFVPIRLGRYGTSPSTAILAPFVNAAWIDRVRNARMPDGSLALVRPERSGWYPSAGVGLLTLFDLVRLDVARGLRDGRWSFSADVSRDFWSVL